MFGGSGKRVGEAIKIPKQEIKKNENPFKDIEEKEMKKIEEKIDDVLEPFRKEDEKTKSKIPAEYFSVAFAGKFQDMIDNETSDEKTVRQWLQISGGASREVDLIDNAGKVVDTVPKLVNEIPTLEEKDNSRVKLMAQTVILEKEEANVPAILLEREERENLSNMGKILMDATLKHQPNIDNANKFREIVNKYSPKLSEEEIQEKLEEPETKKFTKYIID